MISEPSCFGSFNPLPPPKRGETKWWTEFLQMDLSFNPLPPPKRGETFRPRRRGVLIRPEFQSTPPAEARGDGANDVSIHSPRRSDSLRRVTISQLLERAEVSIHSPRRSEGRREFQSTRPIVARDAGAKALPPPKRGEQRRVSIHSPRRSEGRPRKQRATRVSIHSPRRCFNPLSAVR